MLKRLIFLLASFALATGSASAATDQWIEVRSPHFTVLSDADEKQARHILDQFERMRWLFQTMFPGANVDPIEPIVVLAAKNERTFDTLEPSAYLAKGQLKLGGLFERTPDKNYVLLNLDAQEEHPFTTVYHEYTHLQFGADGAWMPLWLNEGMAEFIQNTEVRQKEVVLGEASVDDILYLRQNRIIPLTVLFKVDHNSPYYHEEQKGSVFYAEAWALTHYLEVTDRIKNTHTLSTYIQLMSQGEDSVTAAQQAFGDLNKLQGALESYIQESRYNQFVLSSAAALIDESTFKVRPMTATEAEAARADVLAYVGREQEARTVLDEVLKTDPNNAHAYETLGFLAFKSGQLEEARNRYAQAVKFDSQNYMAQYYFASLSIGMAGEDHDAEIEASLRAAIQLNPRFAPAYDRLASFFGMRRKNLDEAHKLGVQAIVLDPGNLGYRMNAANVLIAMEQYDNALRVLHTAANLAKSPIESAMLQKAIMNIQQIQAYNAQVKAEQNSTVDGGVVTLQESPVVDLKPAHPTEPPDGPKHTVDGVIQDVSCSYPTELEFKVANAKSTVALYINDFSKLQLTAFGFTPAGTLNPCKDLQGLKARVTYAESSDNTIDGQAVAVELRK